MPSNVLETCVNSLLTNYLWFLITFQQEALSLINTTFVLRDEFTIFSSIYHHYQADKNSTRYKALKYLDKICPRPKH